MSTAFLTPWPRAAFLDNNGRPLVGGLLFTYEAGTSTKANTFTDSTGGTPNANPVVLDYRGEAGVWTLPNVAYKYVLAPAGDTDPPTKPIWTVDQIVNAQLITLWGGTDTGSANTYVLNFTANFDAYTDGIVLYWVPANDNTGGASTLNVNGLGPVPILNQDLSQLTSFQLIAGSTVEVVYVNGAWRLISTASVPTSGSFVAEMSGCTSVPQDTVSWRIVGASQVQVRLPRLVGVSNATTAVITVHSGTGTNRIVPFLVTTQPLAEVLDNGAVVPLGTVTVLASLPLTFELRLNGSASGWTAGGNKGINVATTIAYNL